MREYTLGAGSLAVLVVLLELIVFRTGIFKSRVYWITLVISAALVIATEAWLTKLSSPIVIYDPAEFFGRRFPFSIPLEDGLLGFALVTFPIMVWEKLSQRTSRV